MLNEQAEVAFQSKSSIMGKKNKNIEVDKRSLFPLELCNYNGRDHPREKG